MNGSDKTQYLVTAGRKRWEWATFPVTATSPQEAIEEGMTLAEDDAIDGRLWEPGEIDSDSPVGDVCVGEGPALLLHQPPSIPIMALRTILPYAISRLQDMQEDAERLHGEDKVYRCDCYTKALLLIESARVLSGSVDSEAGINLAERLLEQRREDPTPPDSPCHLCVKWERDH